MPPSPQTAFLPLMLLGSFSVARKSSLPVLICPEGCYYTFQASASQAGRAQQQRGRRGGGQRGGASLLCSVSSSTFTHVPSWEQARAFRPFMPAWFADVPKGGDLHCTSGTECTQGQDRQTPLHNQPLTPAHFSPDVRTVSFVNLHISQTWYCMSIIPVFGRWIEGWVSRVQGHPLLCDEFKDKPCLRQT